MDAAEPSKDGLGTSTATSEFSSHKHSGTSLPKALALELHTHNPMGTLAQFQPQEHHCAPVCALCSRELHGFVSQLRVLGTQPKAAAVSPSSGTALCQTQQVLPWGSDDAHLSHTWVAAPPDGWKILEKTLVATSHG